MHRSRTKEQRPHSRSTGSSCSGGSSDPGGTGAHGSSALCSSGVRGSSALCGSAHGSNAVCGSSCYRKHCRNRSWGQQRRTTAQHRRSGQPGPSKQERHKPGQRKSERSTRACSTAGPDGSSARRAAGRTGSDGSIAAAGSRKERHRSRSCRRQTPGWPAPTGQTRSRDNKHGSSWQELLTSSKYDVGENACSRGCDRFWQPQLHFAWGGSLVQRNDESSGQQWKLLFVLAAIVALLFPPSLIARVAGKFPALPVRF